MTDPSGFNLPGLRNFDLADRYTPSAEAQAAWSIRQDADERDASGTYVSLRAQMESFEADAIAKGSEVGAMLASFGNAAVHVRRVDFSGRNVIAIDGELGGQPVRLVVHHTQVRMLLLHVEPAPGRAPQRIGFTTADDSEPTTPRSSPERSVGEDGGVQSASAARNASIVTSGGRPRHAR